MTASIMFANNLEGAIPRTNDRGIASDEYSHRIFFGLLAALFVVSAALTVIWRGAMSPMPEMRMPGGWTMSMAWMRMSGQSWLRAAENFLGMWTVMMVAMMLPSLAPILWRYRKAVSDTTETHLNWLTALVALGYFFVWTAFGAAIFPLGAAIAAVEMESSVLARSVPLAAGVVVLMAGVLQFTAWKARHLAFCREVPGRGVKLAADTKTAWRHGLHLGVHCGHTCANLTAILLVIGVMDLSAMALVTAAITIERIATRQRVVPAIGALTVAAGMLLVAQAQRFL